MSQTLTLEMMYVAYQWIYVRIIVGNVETELVSL